MINQPDKYKCECGEKFRLKTSYDNHISKMHKERKFKERGDFEIKLKSIQSKQKEI